MFQHTDASLLAAVDSLKKSVDSETDDLESNDDVVGDVEIELSFGGAMRQTMLWIGVRSTFCFVVWSIAN